MAAHPLECRDVGFFAFDALPEPLAGSANLWELAQGVLRGDEVTPFFDPPRNAPWDPHDHSV